MTDPFAEVTRKLEEQRRRLEESLRELKAKPLNVVDATPKSVEPSPPQQIEQVTQPQTQPQFQAAVAPQPAPPPLPPTQPMPPQVQPQAQVPALVTQNEPIKQDMAQAAGLNKIIMEQGVSIMLAKIGQALNKEEQEWLSANLISLPGFLSSNSGKAVVKLLFSEYKNWMEK